MSTRTRWYSDAMPECDICKHVKAIEGIPAKYDARDPRCDRWGYMCRDCFAECGAKLGTGHGQELIKASAWKADSDAYV